MKCAVCGEKTFFGGSRTTRGDWICPSCFKKSGGTESLTGQTGISQPVFSIGISGSTCGLAGNAAKMLDD